LRALESVTPDLRLFIDFDDNLRQALREETELFFESILREDRSVTELLSADYTSSTSGSRKHYGIPHIYAATSAACRSPTIPRINAGAAPPRQHSPGHVLRHAHVASDRGKWNPR